MIIDCPYCHTDLTTLYDDAVRKAPLSDKYVTLCHGCGEPIFGENNIFRKPTWEEFQEIGRQEAYRNARGAWMQMKEAFGAGQLTPVESMWREFKNDSIARDMSEESLRKVKSIFIGGAFLAFAYFKQAYQRPNDEFAYCMTLVEAELAALRELINEGKLND